MTRPLFSRVLVVALAAAALVPTEAQAQLSFAELSFEYIAPAGFREGRAADLGVEVETYRTEASFLLPRRLNDTTTMLVGSRYALLAPVTNGSGPFTAPDTLHELQLTWMLLTKLNHQWSLVVLGAPGMSSAFQNVDEDAFVFQGLLQAQVRLSPQVAFGFGLVVSFVTGEFLPLPSLSLLWTPSDDVTLDLRFPGSSRLAYTFADNRMEIGADFRIDGQRYQIGSAIIDTSGYTTVDAGGHVAVRIWELLWVELYGGVTVFRNLELFREEGEDLFGSRMDPAAVAQLSVVFRFPRDFGRPTPVAAAAPEPAPEPEDDGG